MRKIISLFFIIFQLVFTVYAQTTTLVSIDANGKLTYKPDAVGSVIPDFSGVGYKNSEEPIPVVPVLKIVTAVAGDNYTNVQTAINEVAAMPLQTNGFRGAVLFKAGLYGISQQLLINASGIVLRGEGLSTEFKTTGTVQYDLIRISGGSKSVNSASKKMITDNFVPIGAKKITVESGHTFAAGDWVHVTRAPNDAWISLLGADTLSNFGTDIVNWVPSNYIINYERQILKVEGNLLTLDAPMMDIIDPVYATGSVSKISSTRITNCGVENMKMTSAYITTWPSATANVLHDELHGWNAIYLNEAKDCWVKDVIAYFFGYSCVNISSRASFITVDNCRQVDPISQLTGGRRYSFNVDGQRSLVQNCITREGRHDYVNGAKVAGPNVFYNCTATNARSVTGPHHRWSTGILYDNVLSNREINAEDRVQSGTGHSWSGSQIMLWNCTASEIVLHDPPSYHCNWAIGCRATITNAGIYATHPLGIVQSKNTKITAIPSLFVAQLNERLKSLSEGSETSVSNVKQNFHNIYATDNAIVSGTAGQLNVYSLSGIELLSAKTDGKFTTQLSSGCYIVRFFGNDGMSSVAKILI